MPDVMTINQAAEYLQVSVNTMYRMIKSNQVPFVKLRGKYRFFRKSLEEFLYSESSKSTQYQQPIFSKGVSSLYTVK
jgi:excisionase family DNA binding protein